MTSSSALREICLDHPGFPWDLCVMSPIPQGASEHRQSFVVGAPILGFSEHVGEFHMSHVQNPCLHVKHGAPWKGVA